MYITSRDTLFEKKKVVTPLNRGLSTADLLPLLLSTIKFNHFPTSRKPSFKRIKTFLKYSTEFRNIGTS